MAMRLISCAAFFVLATSAHADTLRGVVHDSQGKPVAGARIDLATAAPKVGRGIFCPSCYADCRKWTRTNESGEFVIEGLDPKLKFRVLSTAPGKQTRLTNLIDPALETASLVLDDFPETIPDTQILQGKILTVDGTPIPGALIEPYGAQSPEKRWWGVVEAQSTVSDDNGNFKLLINAKDYSGLDVTVLADGYAGARMALLKPGPDIHQIKVPLGTTVKGRLTHRGQPQPGQRIAVVQTNRTVDNHFIKSVLSVTDHDGRFEFNYLPASQQYAIYTPVGEADAAGDHWPKLIVTTKKFNCRADNEARDLGDLPMTESVNIAGRLEMNDESATPEGLKLSLHRDPAWDLIEVPVASDGRFRFRGLPPETYSVMVNAKGIQLDTSRLKYQITRPNTFGIRLDDSIDELTIPFIKEVTDLKSAESPAKLAPAKQWADSLRKEASKEFVDGTLTGPELIKSQVELSDEPIGDDAPLVSVYGTVFTPTGERASSVTVVLRAQFGGQFHSTGVTHTRDKLATSKTDANGRFSFDRIKIPLRMSRTINELSAGRGGLEVVVVAHHFGLVTHEVKSLNNNAPLRIVLTPEAIIKGVVNNEAGDPIPNALIELYGVSAEIAKPGLTLSDPGEINLMNSQVRISATSDADGQFILEHVPQNQLAYLSASASGFAAQRFGIETTAAEAPLVDRMNDDIRVRTFPIVKSPAKITLKKGPMLQVRVLEHNGAVVSDGTVTCHFMGVKDQAQQTVRQLVSENGIASFIRPDFGQTRIMYATDPLKPKIMTSMILEAENFAEILTVELRLPESRWMHGRVVDTSTGQSVAGIEVYAQNTTLSTKDHPVTSFAISDQNGNFRIPVAEGKNRLGILHEYFGYISSRRNEAAADDPGKVEVDVGREGNLEQVTLNLSPGLILEGTVRDQNGHFAPHVTVEAIQQEQLRVNTSLTTQTDGEGHFRLPGLSPVMDTQVTAMGLATSTSAVVPGDATNTPLQTRKATIDLQLKSGIQLTAKILKDGQPQPNVQVKLVRYKSEEKGMLRTASAATTSTDYQGQFVIGGLETGDSYMLELTTTDGSTDPDWKYQSPYIQKVRMDAKGIIELPEVNLTANNQTLAGIVVNPDGQPVPNVTISPQTKNGGNITGRVRTNRTGLAPETDQSGKFEVSGLPNVDLSIMAYIRNPSARFIQNPVRIQPQRNQTDIRIVLDPSLSIEPEDLDKDEKPSRSGKKSR